MTLTSTAHLPRVIRPQYIAPQTDAKALAMQRGEAAAGAKIRVEAGDGGFGEITNIAILSAQLRLTKQKYQTTASFLLFMLCASYCGSCNESCSC